VEAEWLPDWPSTGPDVGGGDIESVVEPCYTQLSDSAHRCPQADTITAATPLSRTVSSFVANVLLLESAVWDLLCISIGGVLSISCTGNSGYGNDSSRLAPCAAAVRQESRVCDNTGLNQQYGELTQPLWRELREKQQTFSEMFAWSVNQRYVGQGSEIAALQRTLGKRQFFPGIRGVTVAWETVDAIGRRCMPGDPRCGQLLVLAARTGWP
jgi:hypothetical protein